MNVFENMVPKLFVFFTVLSRVREFLPQLAAAEGQLQEMVSSGSPGRVDIEDISDDQPHIALVSMDIPP